MGWISIYTLEAPHSGAGCTACDPPRGSGRRISPRSCRASGSSGERPHPRDFAILCETCVAWCTATTSRSSAPRSACSGGRVVCHHDEGNPCADQQDKLGIRDRILRVEEGVVTHVPNPKHVELLCERMALTEESKGLESTAAKKGQRNEDESDHLMDARMRPVSGRWRRG